MTLKPPVSPNPPFLGNEGVYSVADYGARGDGSTNDTTAIQAALNAAAAAGGGRVYVPPGTYIVTGLTISTAVELVGANREVCRIRLKDNSTAGAHVLATESFAALTGGGTDGGVYRFAVRRLTLDGNKSGNASGGHGLAVYGRAYVIEDVYIVNPKTDGLYTEWVGGGVDMEADVRWLKVEGAGGTGINFKGPHDSLFFGCHVSNAGVVNFDCNAPAGVFVGCHGYSSCPYSWRVRSGADLTQLIGCQGEGSSTYQLWLETQATVLGCNFFKATGGGGIRMGTTAGAAAFKSTIDATLSDFDGVGDKAILWENASDCLVRVHSVNGGADPFGAGVYPPASCDVWFINHADHNDDIVQFGQTRFQMYDGGVAIDRPILYGATIADAAGSLAANGDVKLGGAAKTVGFYGSAGAAKPTVTGSRGANAALTSLLTQLAALGLITNSSS